MRSEREIRAKLDELTEMVKGMAWWDDEQGIMQTVVDALRWALGEDSIDI